MASSSLVGKAAQAAHSAAVSLLSGSPATVGSTISSVPVKEDDSKETTTLVLRGKNVIVGVPGAFTGTCNKHIPGYIAKADEIRKLGIENIFVVAINDVFVMKAWKESLAPHGTPVRFIADDLGRFVGSIGMEFDATAQFGGPRSKRFVIISQGDKVEWIAVEPDAGQITVTGADEVIKQLGK
ncbi:hypothetical protein AX16_007877 [Volvariella volvacea WC 439]|nr:hypothetical protein AX16_007877 [Volvariella volvacea WC 439]